MSGTTERILIVIFLIVAVLLAMRDAHAGMINRPGSKEPPHVVSYTGHGDARECRLRMQYSPTSSTTR
jgi:hypothetical protein